MTVFPENEVKYEYNEKKDREFSIFGDSVGIQDVVVDDIVLEEGDTIYVKDNFETEWVVATFCYAHDNEVYAKTKSFEHATSWRYAKK